MMLPAVLCTSCVGMVLGAACCSSLDHPDVWDRALLQTVAHGMCDACIVTSIPYTAHIVH